LLTRLLGVGIHTLAMLTVTRPCGRGSITGSGRNPPSRLVNVDLIWTLSLVLAGVLLLRAESRCRRAAARFMFRVRIQIFFETQMLYAAAAAPHELQSLYSILICLST